MAFGDGAADHGARDGMRAVPNAREPRVDRALTQIRRAHQVSQRLGGIKEHGVGDASHASRPQTQSDARKDESVVPLPDAVRLAAMDDRVERAAGRHASGYTCITASTNRSMKS